MNLRDRLKGDGERALLLQYAATNGLEPEGESGDLLDVLCALTGWPEDRARAAIQTAVDKGWIKPPENYRPVRTA